MCLMLILFDALQSSDTPSDMEFLTITNVTEEDAGEYVCKVSNYMGEVTQSAWLNVIPGNLARFDYLPIPIMMGKIYAW